MEFRTIFGDHPRTPESDAQAADVPSGLLTLAEIRREVGRLGQTAELEVECEDGSMRRARAHGALAHAILEHCEEGDKLGFEGYVDAAGVVVLAAAWVDEPRARRSPR